VPTLKFVGRYHVTRSNRNARADRTDPDTSGFALGRAHGKMQVPFPLPMDHYGNQF